MDGGRRAREAFIEGWEGWAHEEGERTLQVTPDMWSSGDAKNCRRQDRAGRDASVHGIDQRDSVSYSGP